MAETKQQRRTQAQRRDEAETRLLQAAIELVAENGLARLTLSQIGEVAGYSRGLPAHYFGSKSNLILKLTDHMVEGFATSLARISAQNDGLQWIVATIEHYFERTRNNEVGTRAFFVLFGEGVHDASIRDRFDQLNKSSVAQLRHHIEIGIRNGEIAGRVEPEQQAVLILSMLRGAVTQWLISPSLVDSQKVQNEMVQSVVRNLTCDP